MKKHTIHFNYDKYEDFFDYSVPKKFMELLEKRTVENPTKTNIRRLEILKDVVSGMKPKDICKKHEISSDPYQYLHKTIARACEYVGMYGVLLSVRDLRKCK